MKCLTPQEAERIAAAYGVQCDPNLPVYVARRGEMTTVDVKHHREVSNMKWQMYLRNQRFQRAAAKREKLNGERNE
jgi:hypothetical protein